jgi:hypothetical protein
MNYVHYMLDLSTETLRATNVELQQRNAMTTPEIQGTETHAARHK